MGARPAQLSDSATSFGGSTGSDGMFTTSVTFGTNVFDGQLRWLQIIIDDGINPPITLAPRQPLLVAASIMTVQDMLAERLVVGG